MTKKISVPKLDARRPFKKVGFWSQVALTFFIVSGGPYGLEGSIGAVGPAIAFLLILIVPFVWAIPTSLVVAELSSMMPNRGGYYSWVQRAMGPFWGFQEGWWTLAFSAVDLAIYPVLFVTYLSFFIPKLAGNDPAYWGTRWTIGAIFVISSLLLNLRGSRKVGTYALIQVVAVCIPFLLLIAAAIFHFGDWSLVGEAFSSPTAFKVSPTQIAAGLAIVIWNYSGWDNISTYADEIHQPERVIPRSLALTILLVFISYALPMLAGFKATIATKDWSETSGWPEIASRLLGNWHGWPLGIWLGSLTAFVALLSAWALFNSQLLYISRLPAAMAEDGFLPRHFRKNSDDTGVPTLSLICAATAAILFCGLTIGKLMVVDVLLGFIGLSLEFMSLIALRVKEPNAPRPFRIPLSTNGLVMMSIAPFLIALTVVISSAVGEDGSYVQLGIVAAVMIAGVPLYAITRRKNGSSRNHHNATSTTAPPAEGKQNLQS